MPSRSVFLFCLALLAGPQLFAQESPKDLQKHALVMGEMVSFYSEILGEDRLLNVYLPAGYDPDSSRTYPVIYLLDGTYTEDFLHIVGLVQFGSYPWIGWVPESIVVGIANVDRKKDFTFPSAMKEMQEINPVAGGSSAFMQFLEQEVQASIDLLYRTNEQKTLIGQSLGGLLATEILLKRPTLFSHYIIVSPSLWWDEESLLNIDPSDLIKTRQVFIAVGKEGPAMEKDAKSLHEKLAARGLAKERLFFHFIPELDHATALHLSVYRAFQDMTWTELE